MAHPITKRLKQARTKAGLSQKKLGILAGIDEFSASPRINQYEKGKHIPDFETTKRLAKVLKIPTPFFFTDKDDLADLILEYSSLPVRNKRKLLSFIKDMKNKN